MSNISVCRSFSCPYWSEGKKPEGGGSLGSFGCQKYTVAGRCPVSEVKGVSSSEYELFLEEGSSPNRQTMIALGISNLVFKDIETPEKREERAIYVEWTKAGAV